MEQALEFDAFEEPTREVMVGRITCVENMGTGFRGSFLGWCEELPCPDEEFVFWGESETPGKDLRRVRTRPVTEILDSKQSDVIAFRTENAIYEFKRLV